MVWSVRSKGKEWEAGPQDRELRGRRPGGFKAVGEPEAGSHGGLAGVGMARLRAVGTGRRWEETGGAGRFLSTGAWKHQIEWRKESPTATFVSSHFNLQVFQVR